MQNEQFSTLPRSGQCPFRTRCPYRAVYGENAWGVAHLANPHLRAMNCLPQDTVLALS
jgi:hypothetical protein